MIATGLILVAALLLVPALRRSRQQARRNSHPVGTWWTDQPPPFDWAQEPDL